MELDDGDLFDTAMITLFKKEIQAKSNIKCLSI